jgi:archaeal flagellar protein FlaI
MSYTMLPFTYDPAKAICTEGPNCTLHRRLSPPLQAACEATPFLDEYVHCLPINEIGVPDYYPKISRNLRDLEERNLIYPIKEGLFVHIYPDAKGERDSYVAIEPNLTVNLDALIPQVEERLLDWTEVIGKAETIDDRRAALNEALDAILTTDTRKSNKLIVTPREAEALRYVILRDKVGLGILQPLLLDSNIEDISCSGMGSIFLEHKIFKALQSSINFVDEDQLDQFVIWLGEWIKRPVTVRNPIVDAVLPDGSRINIVYGTDISKRGSNFTIRKFSETPLSIMELIEFGTLDYTMAAYLSFILEEGMNMFIVGATASGKTATMNAITTFILPDKKIVSIEDTPELQVPHKNWIRETTRGSSKDEKGSAVGMFDLLKAALRQRPDRIIIGEIRGEEGAIAFQAMQTGHGVMSTFHAATVEKLIQRLTGEPINIPKAYVDNLDIVLIQAAVKAPGRGMVRRVTSINEIVGYDSVSKSFSFIEAFRWNPANDTFEFPGYMNSFMLEEKIASRRGIPPFKRKAIYTDLKRRAKIFERLHKERKVRGFNEVFQVLAEAHKQKLI